jgi:hypothetical protein
MGYYVALFYVSLLFFARQIAAGSVQDDVKRFCCSFRPVVEIKLRFELFAS